MMLVCPSCDSRYMIGADAIGPEGRKVRCANCGHEWFQEGTGDAPGGGEGDDLDLSAIAELTGAGDEEEISLSMTESPEEDLPISGEAEDEIDLTPKEGDAEEGEDTEISSPPEEGEDMPFEDGEPIPDAVKPLPEGEAASEADATDPSVLKAKIAGYGAATGLFVCVLGIMLLLKGPIFSAFPGSALLYNMFGLHLDLPAQGLVIEKLSAVIDGDNLVVKGRVINLKSEDQDVPLILASLHSEDGAKGESWMIDPPFQVLAGEQSFDFEAAYPNPPEEAASVNLQFAPYMKREKPAAPAPEEEQTEETP